MRARRVVVFAVLLASLAQADPSLAQSAYPPPTDERCAQTGHREEGGFREDDTFQPGQRIDIRGKAGCAPPGTRVSAVLNGEVIGTATAAEDGSYLIRGRIPADIAPGDYTLRVRAGPRTYVHRITIVAAAQASPTVAPTVAPTAVPPVVPGVGTSPVPVATAAPTGGGGLLPFTGSNIVLLVLWAAVLVGLGTLLVTATRRRRAGAQLWTTGYDRSQGFFGPRRRRAPRGVPLLPEAQVPHIDTSTFVPFREVPLTEDLVRAPDIPEEALGEEPPPFPHAH